MPLGGVRSLTGALGSPQNRAGLEDGDLEALQKDHSQADRPQVHCVCAYVCARMCVHARMCIYVQTYMHIRACLHHMRDKIRSLSLQHK